MDVSVLVRYSGHADSTLLRWLSRAGSHSQHLHDLLFVELDLHYIQLDELHAPVAGNQRRSWLWLAMEPVSKIIPALHLGRRSSQDAYRFLHNLKLHLVETCVPAITTDGLRAYFYDITAHFGQWVASRWSLIRCWSMVSSSSGARNAKVVARPSRSPVC
jgi:transposase-like protein